MTDSMIPRDRCDYSAIVDRPPLKLPGRAPHRASGPSLISKSWDIVTPMARQVLPAPTGQFCCRMCRTGAGTNTGCALACWRFFDLYKKLGIRPTLSINARVCEDYPRVAQQAQRCRLGVHGPRL